MQYSSWRNIGDHTFRTSLTDTAVGHRYTAQHRHRGQAQESLEQARLHANQARERRGIERTDGPD